MEIENKSKRNIIYKCSTCDQIFEKHEMRARTISWKTMGLGGKTIRSRVVGWDCIGCMENHPDYQREYFTAAPGNKDLIDGRGTAQEKVSDSGSLAEA